jgi:hypothetical protein
MHIVIIVFIDGVYRDQYQIRIYLIIGIYLKHEQVDYLIMLRFLIDFLLSRVVCMNHWLILNGHCKILFSIKIYFDLTIS